jgi:PPOX class probable F420-dependent enzyme
VLDDAVRRLAKGPNFAVITTLLPDGQPMTHVMWVDCDDEHLLINTERHRQKARNVRRDPRVTVTVWDATDPYRYAEVRGEVAETVTGPEARRHIDELSLKYEGHTYQGRIVSEIVCAQVTKPGLGAAWGGGDHVADLHPAVGHHHPVDQQLHQLAALLEAGPVKAHSELLQHRRHRAGDRAQPGQPLALRGDLPLVGQQVGLLPGKGLVLPLEGVQVDHLGQVGLQQPLPLPGHAGPYLPQGGLPAAQLLGHPGATVGALQGLGDQLGLAEDRAQVRPDQLVELAGGDEPGRAAACAAGADARHLAQAAVVAVAGVAGGAGDPAAGQAADPAADQPAQQVGWVVLRRALRWLAASRRCTRSNCSAATSAGTGTVIHS